MIVHPSLFSWWVLREIYLHGFKLAFSYLFFLLLSLWMLSSSPFCIFKSPAFSGIIIMVFNKLIKILLSNCFPFKVQLLCLWCWPYLNKKAYLIKVPFHCISLWCALSLLSSRDLAHGIVGKYHNSFVKELISSAYKSISFQEGNFLANVFSSFN